MLNLLECQYITVYIQYMREYVCVAYILYVNRIAVFLKYWTKWNEAIQDWSSLSCCDASLMLRVRPQFLCMRSCGDQIIPSAFHGLDCCITSDSRFWRIYLFRRYSILTDFPKGSAAVCFFVHSRRVKLWKVWYVGPDAEVGTHCWQWIQRVAELCYREIMGGPTLRWYRIPKS